MFVNNKVSNYLIQILSIGNNGIGRMSEVRFNNNTGVFLVRIDKPTRNFTIENCHFLANAFKRYLIRVGGASSLNMLHTTFTANRADVILKIIDSSIVTLRYISMETNSLTGNVFDLVDKSNAVLNNLTVINNVFALFSHGLTGSSLAVNHVMYHGNVAKGEGQFARFDSSKLSLSNVVILLNGNNEGSLFNLQMIDHFSSINTSVTVTSASSSNRISIMRLSMNRRLRPKNTTASSTVDKHFKNDRTEMNFICPTNYLIVNQTRRDIEFLNYIVFCSACAKGTYSLDAGRMNILSQYGSTSSIYKTYDKYFNTRLSPEYRVYGFRVEELPNSAIQCKKCPPGGDCDNTMIKSRRNFYGYHTKVKELRFITCPPEYCCSNAVECTSIKSCSHQRTGRLCGQCKPGFQVGYITNRCIKSSASSCKSRSRQFVFWFYYTVSPIVLALVLVFAKELKTFFKKMFALVKYHCFGCWKRVKNRNNPVVDDTRNNVIRSQAQGEDTKGFNDVIEMGSSRVNENEIDVADESTQPASDTGMIISYSGIFSILVSFYQIKSLIKTNSLKNRREAELTFIDDMLNLRFVVMKKLDLYCPFINLDTVSRTLMRSYGTAAVMISTVLLGLFLTKYYAFRLLCNRCFRRNSITVPQRSYHNTTKVSRFYVGLYTVLAFCFKDLATSSFKLINCVEIEGQRVLYISGNVLCSPERHWWQTMSYSFLSIWVIPFPIAVVLNYSLVRQKLIPTWIFFICLLFPVVSPFLYIAITLYKWIRSRARNVYFDEIARQHFEEMFEEPYKGRFWWWEGFKLIERLVFSAIAVFVLDPLTRIFVMSIVLLVLAFLHFRLHPYNNKVFMLYHLDIVSFLCLFFHLTETLFRTFVVVYGSPIKETFDFNLDSIFTPLWYMVGYFLVQKIGRKLKLV